MHSVQFAVLCIMNISVSSQYVQCLLLKQPMLFTQVCILVCNCLPSLTELCMASGLDVDGTYLAVQLSIVCLVVQTQLKHSNQFLP